MSALLFCFDTPISAVRFTQANAHNITHLFHCLHLISNDFSYSEKFNKNARYSRKIR